MRIQAFLISKMVKKSNTLLNTPGLVYLKRYVRSSKYDPLVEEVVHTAPNYAVVCMPSGRETTVSLRNVAPSNS